MTGLLETLNSVMADAPYLAGATVAAVVIALAEVSRKNSNSACPIFYRWSKLTF